MPLVSLPVGRFAVGLFLFGFLSINAQTTTHLRVMTSNLTSGNAQKYESPGLDILKALQPDIVAIQEFNYSNDTPSDFRQMVDETFGTNFSYFRETNSGFSIPNGIISRYPFLGAGSWTDPVVSNRGFAWARIALPGTNELYVVSVHLYSSGTATDRNTEAMEIKTQVQANFPSDAWVIVGGDFNTSTRTEAAVATFKTFLSDDPVPTDAESGGNPDTNENRNAPYDYLLPSFSMTNTLIPVMLPSHTFSNGLVFDSRVYMPLTDVPPVQSGDSGAVNMQHMGVVKDFSVLTSGTNNSAPSITGQPQSQTVVQGSNATFTVTASGMSPLSYQWNFNNAPVSGATTSSFTVTNAQPADAGDYLVIVTNTVDSVTSSVAKLTVDSTPIIVTQPHSQTVAAGQDATFSVTVSGPDLNYQWVKDGTSIDGATASSYTRTNVQTPDIGDYSVLVTNSSGSVTSALAHLSVLIPGSTVIAQWNFNNTNSSAASAPPSFGTGNISLIGGTTSLWVSGTGSIDTNNPNSAWNTQNYPAQGTGNKMAGAQFRVSTVGWQNILIRWDQRDSKTGSKYVRLQYSTNGTSFVDFPTATAVDAPVVFEPKTNSLAGISGINDNPQFSFRIVAEFESTAANTANDMYVGAGGSYGTNGTVRFDMVTVLGSTISTPPAAPVLSAAVEDSNSVQISITGTPGSNYVLQASTNLNPGSWIALATNASPFIFVESNTIIYPLRFYRGISP